MHMSPYTATKYILNNTMDYYVTIKRDPSLSVYNSKGPLRSLLLYAGPLVAVVHSRASQNGPLPDLPESS